ncbi:MAG: hypothetical protein IT522_14020 [Burkholderiales bacterium]|nr:hypothetical protein [Burkholderiales bacterium]
METFIVRIYRRAQRLAPEFAGTIEQVGSGKRVGFTGAEELVGRLLRFDPRGGRAAPATPAPAGRPLGDGEQPSGPAERLPRARNSGGAT